MEALVRRGITTLEVYWTRGMPMTLTQHADSRQVHAQHMCFKGARGYAEAMHPQPPNSAQCEGGGTEVWCDAEGVPLPGAAGRVFTIPQPDTLFVRVVPRPGEGAPFCFPSATFASKEPFVKHRFADYQGMARATGAAAGAESWGSVRMHGVEQAFVFTYAKLQGSTQLRLVLLLGAREAAKLGRLGLEEVFVAVSRVRDGAHLALWPTDDSDLEHLLQLAWSPELRAWHRTYAAIPGRTAQRWNPPGRLVLEGVFPDKALERGGSGLRDLKITALKSAARKLNIKFNAAAGTAEGRMQLLRSLLQKHYAVAVTDHEHHVREAARLQEAARLACQGTGRGADVGEARTKFN